MTWCLELLEPQDRSGCIIRNAHFCNLSISLDRYCGKEWWKTGHVLIQGVYMFYRKVGWQLWVSPGWVSFEKSWRDLWANGNLLNKKNVLLGWKKKDAQEGVAPPWNLPLLGVTKYLTQNLCCLKSRSSHKVHRPWKHAAHESNIACTLNTIGPSGFFFEIYCSSGRSECLKKGREKNGAYH